MVTLREFTPSRRANYLWHLCGNAEFVDGRWRKRAFRTSEADGAQIGRMEAVAPDHSAQGILDGVWTLDTALPESVCWLPTNCWPDEAEYATRLLPTHRQRQRHRTGFPREALFTSWWHMAKDNRILCCPQWGDSNPTVPVGGPVDLLSVAPQQRCRHLPGTAFLGDGSPDAVEAARRRLDLASRYRQFTGNGTSPGDWPPSLVPWHFATPAQRRLVQVRLELVHAAGAFCQLCGMRWATKIDHDHQTGLVRGYLCHPCNAHVDHCPHPAGCKYANYLANPPALHLQLPYPPHVRVMKKPANLRRAELFHQVIGTLSSSAN